MSFQDFIENVTEFKTFLENNTGVTTRCIHVQDESPTFFLPYQESPILYKRSFSIVTGAIGLAILGVGYILASLFNLLDVANDLMEGNNEEALDSLVNCGKYFVVGLLSVVAAAFSPLINLGDFLIGGCNSVCYEGDGLVV